MIGYITLGANDIENTGAFYDAIFASLGARKSYDTASAKAWQTKEGTPIFSIITPYNGHAATAGNGVMIALKADSPEHVNKLHAKALELGASNEGAPGIRAGGYYCAYFRDPEGHKINFHCEAY